ncbi:MAG: CBS domain-containing protein [Candidatus Wallbacteria bacterium]|nr:CBS domain-containing protein [Candidatus Wallbacteria bacterium]
MTMLVKDVMVRNPIVLRPEQSVFSARELMLIHEYECLFVVDDKRHPVGVVTTLFTNLEEPKKTVEKVMKTEFQVIRDNQTVQEAAHMFTTGGVSMLAMPVVDEEGAVTGILRIKELVQDLVTPVKEGALSPESGVIYLSMTRTEEKEKLWLDRIREHNLRPAVTQVGANAEKLPIKMRESAIVAAIAFGVIKEDTREKTSVSNAIRDIILQLKMISPGLGGGFKVGVVRGEGRIAVAAFGRCGHALANSPEQIFMGSSII